MKENEFLDGISKIDTEIVEQYVEIDNKLQIREKRKSKKRILIRIAAVAACVAIIAGAIVILPGFMRDSFQITDKHSPSDLPKYCGPIGSSASGIATSINIYGVSVTAEFIEALPDTYTFFDDYNQYEYRIIRMKTIKHHNGDKMTDEFFFMIPVDFMTDFSVFDRFAISKMIQFGYEYSIVYNKTQNKAERLELVLFGCTYVYTDLMGNNFMAFDSHGNFDERLWNANAAWIRCTDQAKHPESITEIETELLSQKGMSVKLIEGITGETAEVLDMIGSLDNGIYATKIKAIFSSNTNLEAVRYINGFATNEAVNIKSSEFIKEYHGYESDDSYLFTKARFNEADMNALPDLTSAFYTIAEALQEGKIKPIHYKSQEKVFNSSNGAFGWYAKTENGVIGIIKVEWSFDCKSSFYSDDSYFIIEYGSSICKRIDRDDLIQMLGDYETTYIYTGAYDEYGKERKNIVY